jgi:predicted DsbA family dithiol-disulfide isomerase
MTAEVIEPNEATTVVKSDEKNKSDLIEVVCYTDPLCCWSWAAEPNWVRLRNQFAEQIKWKYVMGGLLPNWKRYNDTVDSVSRPVQMGPVWMHASQVSGVPIKYELWHKDPPSSSYPACIAVKCAMLQSDYAAELYLNYVREAVMNKGLNIAKPEVLLLLAKTLAANEGNFDYNRFEDDWGKGEGCYSFVEDLKQTRLLGINRFPTLTISTSASQTLIIVGYKSYSSIHDIITKLLSEKQIQSPNNNSDETYQNIRRN